MEHRVRVNLASTAAIICIGIAVSLITSTVVASRAFRGRGQDAIKHNQTLTVKGYARSRVRSDLGIWKAEVFGEGPTLKDAFAVVEDSINRVQNFLDEQGFKASEIQLEAIDTDTHFARDAKGNVTRDVSSYTLKRRIVVTSANVARIDEASGQVTALIKDNVRIRSFSPEFTYTKIADEKIKILGEASADARTRADEIAGESGCAVVDVRSARQGVMQITRPDFDGGAQLRHVRHIHDRQRHQRRGDRDLRHRFAIAVSLPVHAGRAEAAHTHPWVICPAAPSSRGLCR